MTGTVFFRGIAEESLPWHEDISRTALANAHLREIVRRLLTEGARCFHTNLQTAADVFFTQTILQYKSVFPNSRLEICLPYPIDTHPDLLSAADAVTVFDNEPENLDFAVAQVDVRLVEKTDIAVIMPLESMPRDASSVLISRMARQKGIEVIFYSDEGIYRTKARRLQA